MIKKTIISWLFKFATWLVVVGIGIWYLSSSIGGASLSYTSMDTFLRQIGVENGDISSANGCFLCGYITDLFKVLGNATEMFWNGIVHNLWILMAVGFGIFIIVHTIKYLHEQATSKDVTDLSDKEPKLEFAKWFEKVWKTGLRVLLAGVFIGALNWSGTSALKATTNIIVTPVMYVGSVLSMAATDVITDTKCEMAITPTNDEDILNPVLKPFMCVMGNLNAVTLAGAGGGFALMNYAWLGFGGGAFTWVAGLALVILFLYIGFDLFFQVLSIIFKLIFIIIFLPVLIAAAAFEQVWPLAKNLLGNSINMLVNSAVSILKISLKISILFAALYLAADHYYPSPKDNFTSILPPLMGQASKNNMDDKTLSIMNAFTECEQISLENNEMNKDKFATCFKAKQTYIEQRYPGAFDFMKNGFSFILFMICFYFLYTWIVSPKIDELLGKDDKEIFNFDDFSKKGYKSLLNAPERAFNAVKNIWKKYGK